MVQSRGHAIWIVCIIFPIITGVFIALRAYTRIYITKNLALSDYVAFATMIAIIAYSVTLAQDTYHGMGQHEADFTEKQLHAYYFWIVIASEFYCLSLAGFKSAILLMYLQLFGVSQKFRYWCYAALFYTNGFCFSNMITELAGCHPLSAFWDPKGNYTCIDYVAADIAYGFGYMSSDLIIAILPIPMIWQLKLVNKQEKFGLALVLTTGGIAFIISTARWIVATIDLTSDDRTWVAGATFLLSVVEVNTGLICSCTPSLKPLFISARRASIGWSDKRSSRRRSYDTDAWSSGNRTSVDKALPALPDVVSSISSTQYGDYGDILRELGSGRLSKAEMGLGRLSKAEMGSGRLSKAEMDSGRLSKAEMGSGRPSKAEMGSGRLSKAEMGSGRLSKAEMGSSASRHEMLVDDATARHELSVEEALAHELEVKRLGLENHDAYDGVGSSRSGDDMV